MVLHKNKWDKKATRAHVRKLKAQGKEDDTKKLKSGKKEEGGAGGSKQEFPELPGAEEEGVHDDQDSQEGEDEEGDGVDDGERNEGNNGGQFSRRKMQNNTWRYEQEGEEPAPGEELEEPEPDYVSMTIHRKGQFNGPEEGPKGDLDEEFLKDLPDQRSLGARRSGRAYGENYGGTKGKVVKVDRKQFEDVTTKIAKQSTADAFRQRFAPRKAKSRVRGGGTGEELDDVDSFLEELKVVEITASRPAGSREISGGLGKSRTNESYEHDKDDDWLDGMLGGR